MSQTKYQNPEFKLLLAEWNKKLADAGFKDIENGPYLKEWDSSYFQTHHEPLTFSAHHDYFYLAHQFLHKHTFSSPFEKTIWMLHSEGCAYRDIARSIDTAQNHTPYCTETACDLFCEIKTGASFIVNKDKVGTIIKRLKALMLKTLSEDTGE